MSFGNNLKFILALADKLPEDQQLVVFYRPDVEVEATQLAAYGVKVIPFRDNLHFVFTGIPGDHVFTADFLR